MASGKATMGAVDVPGMTEGPRASVVRMPHEDRVVRDAARQQVREDDQQLVDYSEAQKKRGKFPLGVDASLTATRSLPATDMPAVPQRARRREFPDDVLPRQPLSKNQRVQRARRKAQVLSKMPQTEWSAVGELASSSEELNRLNTALYDAASDVNMLSAADQAKCRRVDSAIRRYETAGPGQDHLLYAEIQLPSTVVSSNVRGYTRHAFPEGEHVYVDNYMPARHSLDAVSSGDDMDERRRPVFEIQTQRGMYLGQGANAKPQATGHLLPRAMKYKVVGVREADYVDEHGHLGTRTVVQLVDADRTD